MKWLSLILTYAIGKFSSLSSSPSPQVMIEQLLSKGRYLLLMANIAIISSALFCAGIIISIIDATSQFDNFASIYWSATLTTGVVLAVLSLISLAITFNRKIWERKEITETRAKDRTRRTASPIEEAITLLVMDFVDERKARREAYSGKYESNPHYPPSNPHANQDVVH